ncbi:unnamed protein product, partial [Rotaria sordida]
MASRNTQASEARVDKLEGAVINILKTVHVVKQQP